jgi:DNA polymerase-1
LIVKPIGPKDAKIMLIGEAPGAEEEITGIPFVGGAGKVLNGLLRDAGIDREACVLTNVMQVRPVNNDFGNFYEDKGRKVPRDILLEGIERLKNEITAVNPNVIVAFGNEPLKALTGLQKITKRRGSLLQTVCNGKAFKLIPTMHPAGVMRFWEFRPLVLFDLKKALEESAFLELHTTPRYWKKVESIPELKAYMQDYLASEYIAFDIETCNNQISCISFANDARQSFTVPICIYDKSFWTPEEELVVWQLIKQLLESSVKKIAQNANFDMFFLWTTVGIRVKNLWLDTMNAFHTLYPELPKALDLLTSLYTDQPYYKDTIKTDIYHYNCLDSMVTYECAMKIEQELKDFGVHELYHKHTHPILEPLLEMQVRGHRIDVKKKVLAAESTREDITAKQKQLEEAVGYELNVNSPKQMKAFLYDDLKLPPVISRKTGKITADEAALNKLGRAYPNPIFDLIVHVRGQRKLLSTYLEATTDPDGRFRCRYILFGTETGRLSSKLSWTDTGGNLQNVPKGIAREIFIPDEGKMFMSADLSQAELRVVAYLADERQFIKVFEAGRDVHKMVASYMFDKPEDKITHEERELGKRIVHASNYGMGAGKLAELSGMSYGESEEKMNLYHVFFPKIRIWHMAVEAQLKKTRILTTPMGRKRMFFGRWNKAMLRDAYSYVPQSTVADICLKGMVNLYEKLPKGCNIVFNIHDEIVIQIPAFDVPVAKRGILSLKVIDGKRITAMEKLMISCMSIPITIDGKTFIIPVGVKTGMNWNEVS